jgi:WD40 repeat protein/energy-coupling factor transporter ATP-binding protein EcfA2
MLKQQPLQAGLPEKPFENVLVNIELRIGNPFPGLRPFTLDESHLFFGRESQVDEILVKLSQNRFITVLGYSGSGKSSLMYCGLMPALYGGFMNETGPHWNIIVTRPGASPISNLVESIVDHLIVSDKVLEKDKAVHRTVISSILRSGAQGLIEVSRYLQSQGEENVFFLIDQFEELIHYRLISVDEEARDEAQLYVNLILAAVRQKTVPVYIALGMRSDFMGNCSVFPGLTHAINQSNYLVPQMTREQMKVVIEGPVAVAGGRIAERLVKRLLSDVGNNQDQLPILQHALMRTWDNWIVNREEGEVMDIRHYQAIGTMNEALSLHANETYDELTTRQREIGEILFKNITEKSQDNLGMRRPEKLSLIAQLAETEEEDVIGVVENFRRPGRSLLMPPANVALTGDSIIELSHESLMRIWRRLTTWVEEEYESAQMYKRLSEAAAMYQIGKTGLWRPPDLQLALNWQKKQRPTREWAQRYDDTFERAIVFLDTSRITYEAELKNQEMLQKRVLQRTRATAVILGVAFVVAILFFLLSYIQKIKADEQTRIAEAQRQEAQNQREEALLQKQEADKQKGIADTAVESVEDALEGAQKAQNRAEAALIKAKQEEQKAIAAGKNEKEARFFAEERTRYATEQYERATRLYILAIAQNLATKSVQENDDYNLAGLLAMQGYHFHTKYEGKTYDPYIYEGLYSSLRKLSGSSYNAIHLQGPPHVHIKSLAVSAIDNSFFTSGADGRIMKGDYAKLTSVSTGFSNPYPSKTIALSKDENYIVNGSDSSFIQIYDLKSSRIKPLFVIKDLKGSTNDIEFLPDGHSFIIASSNKTLSIGDPRNGSLRTIASLPYEIKALNASVDGRYVAGAAWTGQVVLYDLQNNSLTVVVDDIFTRVLCVKFSPSGDSLAYGLEDFRNKRGLVKVYDFKSGQTRQFSGHRAGVNDVEFSPDGKLLASAGSDKRLLMWVLENPEDLPIIMDNNNGFIWDISFTKNSEYLIAACSESEIRVWPTDPAILAKQICPKVTRNMTADEWKKYVGEGDDIKHEPTCAGKSIKGY